MFLGNDLVHWSGAAAREKETLSRRTARFIDRVLHEREQPFLERVPPAPLSRGRLLWALWAAKEAAFKAAMKAIPDLPFSPRSIRIEFHAISDDYRDEWPLRHGPATDDDNDIDHAGSYPLAYGLAHVREQVYEILWEYHRDFVHAVALGPLTTNHRNLGTQSFSDHWAAIVRGVARIPADRASRAVRRTAVNLLAISDATDHGQSLTMNNLRVVRNFLANGRLGPPSFHDGSSRDDLDLSLTHDGPWGAAAILRHSPAASSKG